MRTAARLGRALLGLSAALGVAAAATSPAHSQEPPDAGFIDRIVASLSVNERVGQLVMVNFVGDDAGPDSDIAGLVRDFNVGSVLVTASNGNIVNRDDTAAQLAGLTDSLQQRAYDASRRQDGSREYFLPLLVAVDNEGDLYPFSNVTHNYTQLPNNMAIGATWSKPDAEAVGRTAGHELSAAGINMLLGPVVDVLDSPRSGGDGDIGVRSFGGNAAWVGALGRAYVRGVHEGSGGRMLTVAKHFPGHGGSDRSTDAEVPTVNKSLDQLRELELAPFAELQRNDANDPLGVTDAMMVSHIRYRNFVPSSPAPFTRPISIDAAAFQTLMALPEFAAWRGDHLVMADALGVQAMKRWYALEAGQQEFPYRDVVHDALLAGNDLLPLIEFYVGADRGWRDYQLPVMQDAIGYMRDQYQADPDFRRRVDEAVRRVITAKLQLYPQLSLAQVRVDPANAASVAGGAAGDMRTLAEAAVTLIEPASQGELRARLPRGPLSPEKVLIVECWSDCYAFRVKPRLEMQQQLLALYGPNGAGRLRPEDVSTISFSELDAWLRSPDAPEQQATAGAVRDATWLIFALGEYNPEGRPASAAVKRFLDVTPIDLRNKQVVAIAYAAPYHLDSTEISKLSAYFAVYHKTDPAIEASFRALFGDISPRGRSPVDIAGVFYDVDGAVRPDPAQTIALSVYGHDSDDVPAGEVLGLVAGPIVDRGGFPVPDGTTVDFRLQPSGASDAPLTATGMTVDGIAGARFPPPARGGYTATASVAGIASPPLGVTVAGAAPPAVTPESENRDGGSSLGTVLALAIGVPAGIAIAGGAGAGAALLRRRRSRRAVPMAEEPPPVAVETHAPAEPPALRVEMDARRVYVKGEEVRPPMSGEQFRLLAYLYERYGKVVGREELIEHVWPDAHVEGVSEEALDALVRRVRERIVQAGGERSYIVTLRGQGFRLEA